MATLSFHRSIITLTLSGLESLIKTHKYLMFLRQYSVEHCLQEYVFLMHTHTNTHVHGHIHIERLVIIIHRGKRKLSAKIYSKEKNSLNNNKEANLFSKYVCKNILLCITFLPDSNLPPWREASYDTRCLEGGKSPGWS